MYGGTNKAHRDMANWPVDELIELIHDTVYVWTVNPSVAAPEVAARILGLKLGVPLTNRLTLKNFCSLVMEAPTSKTTSRV